MLTDNEVKAEPIDDTVEKIKKWKKESDTHLGGWLKEAEECYDMVSGNQWKAEDKSQVESVLGRTAVCYNRTTPVIDAVSGAEISNRQEVRYIPRTPGDSKVNEVLTAASKWIREGCNAEDEESDAFYDALVCGLGWTETRLDYQDEPDGKILVERVDPMTVRYDPSAKKRNLTDKKWILKESWLDKDEIKALWPDKIDEIAPSSMWADDKPEEHDATLAWLYEKDATGYDKRSSKYRVMHAEWFESETYYRVQSPDSGQLIELDKEKFEKLEGVYAQAGMPLQSVKQTRKKYKQAFVCGDVLLEEKDSPSKKCFTLNAITAKRDRNKNIWFGLVRPMMDPQRFANKFFSQILHIVNSNAKGGLMVEEGAVTNMRKFEEEWAKADSIVKFKDGALGRGSVQPKPTPAYPATPEKMMEFSIASIRDVTGVNLELMGLADRQQAGILEQERKQSGMVILSSLFDSLRHYRKEQGKVMAYYITEYISDGRLIRITGEEGEAYIPLIRDPEAMEYDVIVDDAPSSYDVKERTWRVLTEMWPMLQESGMAPPPESLIEFSPLPTSLVESWKAAMAEKKNQPEPPPPEIVKIQEQSKIEQMKLEQTAQADSMKAQQADMAMQAKMAQEQSFEEMRLDQQGRLEQMRLEQQERLDQMRMEQEELAEQRRLAHAERLALIQQETALIIAGAKNKAMVEISRNKEPIEE